MEQTNEKKNEKINKPVASKKKNTSTKKASSTESSEKNKPTKNSSTSKSSSTKKASTRSTSKSSAKIEKTDKPNKLNKISSNSKATKKTATVKKLKAQKEIPNISEYYDLPYCYNQTVVKILAQTPHSLFVYWDISDDDRKKIENKYGKNFFHDTKPVLIVHNETQNYSFEVEIDDFTNSWYLKTPTSNCKFNIELCRKKINTNNNFCFDTPDNRLHITASNTIESPNDHILFDSIKDAVMFKNIKTNQLEERKVLNYNTLNDLYNSFDFSEDFIHNPSSNFKI